MRTFRILFICLFCAFQIAVDAQINTKVNSIGFGVACIPPYKKGLYFGQPWDFHPNRELSFFIQGNYHRAFSHAFHAGTYMEFEKVCFSVEGIDSVKSFRRFNLGIELLGKFPAKPLHLQVGAFLGGGILRANHWDDLKGVDFGLFAGPAWEYKNIGFSAQLRSGYASYKSDGTPAKVRIYTPKLQLRMYLLF